MEVCLLSGISKMPPAGIDRTKGLSAWSRRGCLCVRRCALPSRFWQVASYHWLIDKCIPTLHKFSTTGLLTHRCVLKSSEMSVIHIHEHWYINSMSRLFVMGLFWNACCRFWHCINCNSHHVLGFIPIKMRDKSQLYAEVMIA